MSARVDRELADVLAKLRPEERRQILEYARALQVRADAGPAPSLLDLVGSISGEDLVLMREAIEEEFERVP